MYWVMIFNETMAKWVEYWGITFQFIRLGHLYFKDSRKWIVLGKVVSYLFKATIEFRSGPLSDSLSV